jgi:hypothetical protein
MRSLVIVLGTVGTLLFAGEAHAWVPITKSNPESMHTLIQKGESCFNRCMRTRCKRTKYPPACCSRVCNRN